MKGQIVYLVNLMPYCSPEVFANYNEAERWMIEQCAKEKYIRYDDESMAYTDEDNHIYYVKTLVIK